MSKKNQKVSEDELLKALSNLEAQAGEDADEGVEADEDEGPVVKAASDEDDSEESDESSDDESVGKAHTEASPGMPASTKEANGGFKEKGASDDAEHFETSADEVDPSMKSLVAEDGTLRKGFEISGFLEALTDATVESVDGLRKSNAQAWNEQRAHNARVSKALTLMGNLMLKMAKSQADDAEAPVTARPRSVVAKSQVSERFVEQSGGDTAKQYTREQTLEALTDMAVKGEVPSLAVSAYETSGFVEPAFHTNVNAKLKAMFG